MPSVLTDPRISSWPALLLAPLLALGYLSLALALVTPSCARQDSAGLHSLALFSLVLAGAMTLLAWRAWASLAKAEPGAPAVTVSDAGHAENRARFVALMGTLVGALSSLVIVAMWVPLWLLPPCS